MDVQYLIWKWGVVFTDIVSVSQAPLSYQHRFEKQLFVSYSFSRRSHKCLSLRCVCDLSYAI